MSGAWAPPWGSALQVTPPYSLRRGLEDLEGLGVLGDQAVQGCHLCQGGQGVPGGWGEEEGEPQWDRVGGPGRAGRRLVGVKPTLSPLGPVSPLGPCQGEMRRVVRKGGLEK